MSEFYFTVETNPLKPVWAIHEKNDNGHFLIAYVYGGSDMAHDFVEFLQKKNKKKSK